MIEEWRAVIGWEGLYEVSNQGRVRSLDRTIVDKRGRRQSFAGTVLTTIRKLRTGYHQVSLCDNGRQQEFGVHQLVARAFLGPPELGQEVCHGDADRTNNHVSNLRWGSRKENQQDKVAHGNHPAQQRTHCPRGHALVAPNLTAYSQRRGGRACLACSRAHSRYKYYGKTHDFQKLSDAYHADIMRSAA